MTHQFCFSLLASFRLHCSVQEPHFCRRRGTQTPVQGRPFAGTGKNAYPRRGQRPPIQGICPVPTAAAPQPSALKIPMFTVLCAAVGFSAVESANIVGYQEVPRYSTFTFAGSMFAEPGQNYYYLNNVVIDSVADTGADFIQFFKPGTTILDKDQSYYFDGTDWCYKFDASSSEVGDWEEDDVIPANFQVPCNIGFLTRFTSGLAANSVITYAGEVQQGDGSVKKVDRVSAYQIVVNPLPRNVDLTELTVESIADTGADFIQFFKPGTTILDKDQSYYFDGDCWCYKFDASSSEVGDWEEDDEVPANTKVIRPGEGFLIRFTSGLAVNAKVVFPSPVAAE